MEITKTIQPGEMGSKQFHQKYGERLVCVRYRTDKQLQKRYTTVELIVAEKPLPGPRRPLMTWVKVNFDELELRGKVKAAGGKWLAEEKVWELGYEAAKRLKLKKRILRKFTKSDG
jgi:hypothetical protein